MSPRVAVLSHFITMSVAVLLSAGAASCKENASANGTSGQDPASAIAAAALTKVPTPSAPAEEPDAASAVAPNEDPCVPFEQWTLEKWYEVDCESPLQKGCGEVPQGMNMGVTIAAVHRTIWPDNPIRHPLDERIAVIHVYGGVMQRTFDGIAKERAALAAATATTPDEVAVRDGRLKDYDALERLVQKWKTALDRYDGDPGFYESLREQTLVADKESYRREFERGVECARVNGHIPKKPTPASTAATMASASSARYSTQPCGSIYDRTTKLQWLVGPDRDTTFEDASTWVSSLTECGGDWRLPSATELRALHDEKSVAGTGWGERGKYYPAKIDTAFSAIGGGSWVWTDKTQSAATSIAYNLFINSPVPMKNDLTGGKPIFATRVFAVK